MKLHPVRLDCALIMSVGPHIEPQTHLFLRHRQYGCVSTGLNGQCRQSVSMISYSACPLPHYKPLCKPLPYRYPETHPPDHLPRNLNRADLLLQFNQYAVPRQFAVQTRTNFYDCFSLNLVKEFCRIFKRLSRRASISPKAIFIDRDKHYLVLTMTPNI